MTQEVLTSPMFLCSKLPSLCVHHFPLLDGIGAASLCVMGPLRLAANGESPLAQAERASVVRFIITHWSLIYFSFSSPIYGSRDHTLCGQVPKSLCPTAQILAASGPCSMGSEMQIPIGFTSLLFCGSAGVE